MQVLNEMATTARAPRILTVLARAGVERYASAERDLDDLFSRQLSGGVRDVIVVDNLLPPGIHERAEGRMLVGGDNSAWEFSAFDVGIATIGDRLFDYDWIHVATSAFGELYTSYLERFTMPVLDAAAGLGVCLCHIDCYNEAITVLGRPSQHWARTSFVMLPPAELRRLGSLVSVNDRGRFFSGNPQEPFRQDAPLSPTYRAYIIDWLTGQDIGQSVTWHSRLSLTEETLPSFEQKATAILNEHLLSIRLRAQGCALVDVTWLSALVASGRPIDWSTPWRGQLAGRDRDALVMQPV